MPTPTKYTESLRDLGTILGTKTAPQTGQYYSYVYSQNDHNTNIPTLGVDLHQVNTSQPIPINNLTDAQILEMIQNKKQITQNTNESNPTSTLDVSPERIQGYTQETLPSHTTSQTAQETADIPLGGILVLILLLVLVGFVYFIIRMWQDHQAQQTVMTNIFKETPTTEPIINAETTTVPTKEIVKTQSGWRTEIEQANKKLRNLLAEKGIEGETISDKLKSIRPGQFALADMAWEAQQGAKKLLITHESMLNEQAIKRVLQLFRQVFAEHNVI